MKVSITVVATKTFTAGRRMFGTDEDIYKNAGKRKSTNLAQSKSGFCDRKRARYGWAEENGYRGSAATPVPA
jgi:hypothetical protein